MNTVLSTAHKKVTRKDCLSVHSTLQHITFVCQNGHSFLAPFSTFISKFSNNFMCHHVPNPVFKSLHWWQAILSKPCYACSLVPRHNVDTDIWLMHPPSGVSEL